MALDGFDWCGVTLTRSSEPPAHDERAVYGFTAGVLSAALFVGRPTKESLMQVRVRLGPDVMLYENVGNITHLLRESAEAVSQIRAALSALPE